MKDLKNDLNKPNQSNQSNSPIGQGDWLGLAHLAGIRLTGPDADTYIQAQVTADLRDLPANQWQISTWCDPQGRVLAIILLARHEQGVDVILPTSQAAEIQRRLVQYSLGRKLEISAHNEVCGRSTRPEDPFMRQDPSRALSLGPGKRQSAPDELLAWQRADLCLPLPWLAPQTAGKYLPQMLGLEQNAGLSYRKGCFPGQEVIARVHYLGRQTRYLTGLQLDQVDAEFTPGCPLHDEQERKIGECLARVPEGQRTLGLAVVEKDIAANQTVMFFSSGTPVPGRVTPVETLC